MPTPHASSPRAAWRLSAAHRFQRQVAISVRCGSPVAPLDCSAYPCVDSLHVSVDSASIDGCIVPLAKATMTSTTTGVETTSSIRRLYPDPGPTAVVDEVHELDLIAGAPTDRPYVVTNFALTVDGRATLHGRSGPIGSRT